MAEGTDLIGEIIADHRSVETVTQELEGGEGTPASRRELVDHVIAELVRHSVAEEHPSAPDKPPANKILDPGAGLVDRLRDALTGRSS